ncbi:MAG: hypothetical protein ACR2KU_05170 [Gammaproteobacteria bacterium]
MNEEIKRHLTAILERLDGWESGGWEEYQATEKIPSYRDWFDPDHVFWIADRI